MKSIFKKLCNLTHTSQAADAHLRHRSFSLPLVHGPTDRHGGPGITSDAPGQDRVTAPVMLTGSLFLVALSHLTRV